MSGVVGKPTTLVFEEALQLSLLFDGKAGLNVQWCFTTIVHTV